MMATPIEHRRHDEKAAISTEGMAEVTDHLVRAARWAGGWELDIADEGVTQVRTLDKAEQQVRDYLTSLHDRDYCNAAVTVIPDLDGLEDQVRTIREKTQHAAKVQAEAAQESRAITRRLRASALSVTDTAAILGISRGRVSQLEK